MAELTNSLKACAVFCSSQFGKNESFLNQTIELGTLIAKYQYKLIYGGGNRGLMGAVANAAMEAGAFVIGIIPNHLAGIESINNTISELLVVEDMHSRKKLLFEKSDLVVIMPGGMGTLDELFECLTWNQLQLHNKKIVLVNIDGFYNSLIAHMKKMEEENFLYIPIEKALTIVNKVSEIEF